MTITTSDMGGSDRRERTLEQHRENVRQAIISLGYSEVIELLLFHELAINEGHRLSAVATINEKLGLVSKVFVDG